MFTFLIAAFSIFGNFEQEGISYEWEITPSFAEAKTATTNAILTAYDPIPLEVLGLSSRAELIQYISDDFDKIYADTQKGGSLLRWLMAKDQGAVVGYLLIDLKKFPEEIYLAEMVVDPSHQRRGIASAMVSSLFGKCKKLVVITRKANDAAKGLYRTLGFTESSYMHEGYSEELYCGFERQSP
jgi:ribosomal protein S18 acetylase RimI-like enzyme